MTTFTVPRTRRPISEGMFADLGVPHVDFTPTADGGQQVTVPVTLTDAQVLRGKIRLLTATQYDEDALVAALGALTANTAYLAIASPTAAQAIPQVHALTAQMNGLIQLIAPDALGGTL